MKLVFRDLKADEIDVRVDSISEKGVSLVLYKDARVDMDILDETVGALNWKRSHVRDNANCIISIYDADKKEWVSKEDTGTESFTEKEKGLASDSFKRAGFNWGIGRELYTSPFIYVFAANTLKIVEVKGKLKCQDKFSVKEIVIEDKKIVALKIALSTGKIVFEYANKKGQAPIPPKKETLPDTGPEDVIDDMYKEVQKEVEAKTSKLTAGTRKALKDMIESYEDLSGRSQEDVLELLEIKVNKAPADFTEDDAIRAVAVLIEMHKEARATK